jgi:NAD(P) transhydrogenase subunit alpha
MMKCLLVAVASLLLLTGAALAQVDVAAELAADAAAVAPACCPVPVDAPAGPAGSNAASMGLLFFVFVLAIFLGAELIAKVPSQLHTPLMSGSNAISGISIVGALLALTVKNTSETAMIVLGTLAVALAMINVVGGYLVTDRMLGMFQAKKGGK